MNYMYLKITSTQLKQIEEYQLSIINSNAPPPSHTPFECYVYAKHGVLAGKFICEEVGCIPNGKSDFFYTYKITKYMSIKN